MNCRLLYLIGQLRPGGSERQLYSLLRVMDRERYRPAVAVWNFSEEDIYVPQIRALGVPLYSVSAVPSTTAKLRKFRCLVRQLKPEVVHSYSFYLNFAAYWSTQGTPAVAFGSIRSDFTLDKKSTTWWLNRLSARWPRHQICNSVSAAETIRRSQGPFAPRQLFIVRNGLDLNQFRRFPLPHKNRVCILGVGSLLPIKRWDRLLVAAGKLKRCGVDFLVRLAGGGPWRGLLEQKAQDLGLTGCIEFLGHVDDIPGLLSEATFLVHPSDTEGCPNVVMEAMACGRAVVATDVGDVPFLVEDGKTGFVVHRGDSSALAERIQVLITDNDLCRRMGEAGRAKAEREFGLDRLVTETFAAYRAEGWWKET